VTAGFYVVSESARRLAPPTSLGRLREYLAWLCESGEPIRAFSIETAVDVDRPEDVRLAETLLSGSQRASGGEA
jgi:hypothetical protein